MPKRKVKSRINSRWLFTLITLLLILITLSFSYLALTRPKSQSLPSSQITLAPNLTGMYQGNLPCADCPGIKETLTLTATDSAQTMGSFLLQDLYLERDPNPIKTTGVWEVNQSILKLVSSESNSQPQYFQVLPNGDLQMLDSNMQKIDSPFNQTLIKKQN